MLRRLEELDRLDRLAADPETVLWPDGRSSRTDPRAWQPGRHRVTGASHWWERHPVAGFVVVALVIGGWVATPRIPGWIDQLLPAAPGVTAQGPPPPGVGGGNTRVMPAVEITDVPSSSRFAFMMTQSDGSTPVTFDPCRPVHYVVRDFPGAGEEGRKAITAAVAEVSAASGLYFVDDGNVSERPTQGRAVRQGSEYAPVLIAWTDETESPELAGDVVGLGGGRPIADTHRHLTYVTGTVWLDTPSLTDRIGSRSGFADAKAVIMHELGHVLGAGHVQDDRELMAEHNSGRTSFGAGDRYALSVLGQGQCVPGL